jgi:hypothetical protein
MARSSFSRRARSHFRRRIVLEALERRELLASYSTPEDTRLLVSDPALVGATIVGQALHGRVFLSDTGGFLYEPNRDYHGPDRFLYVVTDATTPNVPSSNTNPATNVPAVVHEVSLTVTPVNDAPFAGGDQFSVVQDSFLTIEAPGVLQNDSDVDNNAITAKPDRQPEHGTLKLNENGSFIYTPVLGYTGPDKFTYVANDGSAVSEAATVWLFVSPARPDARDDGFSTDENKELVVAAPGVLANDKGINGRPLTASLVLDYENSPKHGTVTLAPDGSFVYKPNAGFVGTDIFVYRATDVSPAADSAGSNNTTSPLPAASDTATVYVYVVPTAPYVRAINDTYSTEQDTALEIAAPGVLKNDLSYLENPFPALFLERPTNKPEPVDIELVAEVVERPSHGTLELQLDGSFRYVPRQNYFGTDKFSYRAKTRENGPDGDLPFRYTTNVGQVTIQIKPTYPQVEMEEDSYITKEGETLTVAAPGVLRNDRSPLGHPISAVLLDGPDNGQLSFRADGSFEYVPKNGFSGVDRFIYRAVDATAVPAGSIGGAPVIHVGGTTGFPPAGDFAFAYIYVEPAPGPVAVNDHFLTAAHTTLEVRKPGVLANDYVRHLSPIAGTVDNSPVRPPLVAVLLTQPENGTLTLNPDGSFKYEPKDGFTGIDKFTYQALLQTPGPDGTATTVRSATDAADGILPNLSNVATVTIRVVPAVAHNDSYSTLQDTELKVEAPGVLGNDDGGTETQPLVATLLRGPLHGKLELKADGSFIYVPKEGYVGPDLFTYRAGDGSVVGDPTAATSNATTNNAIDVGVVKIYVRPKTPEAKANEDKFVTRKNTTLTIAAPGVLANDLRPANVPLVASIVEAPVKGTLELKADGGFTYVPETDFVGAVKFTYRASLTNTTGTAADGSIGGSIATVTIYVLAEDHLPRFIPGGDQITTDESGEQKVADWATLVSIGGDGGPANFVVTTDKPQLFAKPPAIDATGQLAFTPAPNASGTARVTVAVEGAAGETAAFDIQVDKPRPLFNAAEPCDVDGDLHVAAGDALEIINYLNALGSTPANLPEGEAGAVTYYDVDGDGVITAGDALEVINLLNSGLADGVGQADRPEGEHAAATDLSILALTADDAGGSNQRRRRSL